VRIVGEPRAGEPDEARSVDVADPIDDVADPGHADRVAVGAGLVEERPVHRVRDLDRRGRWMALLLAVALLVAPAVAFVWAVPDWSAQGDPALMAMRALDVGTERTPLTGQPSTGDLYVDGVDRRVSHLGPTHLYLLAPAIRLFGADVGMPVVSVLIIGSCLLLAAWAVLRQLGPAAGALAAVVLGLITFTTGASSLVDPVSSSISGYPVLCAAVLVWCLLCGDVRLLPLVAGVVSFAAQQHLSSLPALSFAVVAGVAGLVVHLTRRGVWRDRSARRAVLGWTGGAAGVALALWSPVLLQQVAAPPGNLTALVQFTLHDERPSVGFRIALRPLVHALGLPPVLGRLELTGLDLLREPAWTGWLSAALVVAVVAALGLRWRKTQPRRTALVVMAGALVAGGLLNASSMPVGIETSRIVFYHWVFALGFFVVLALGLAVWDVARSVLPLATTTWLRPALTGGAALAVAVPALVNPTLDRRTNDLYAAHSPHPREMVDELADAVMARRDELGDHPVLLVRSDDAFVSLRDGLALELVERGLDVRSPAYNIWFVDYDHLADPDTTGGIVLVLDRSVIGDAAADAGLTGEPLVEAGNGDDFDDEALDQLVAAAEAADEVRYVGGAEAALSTFGDHDAALLWGVYLEGLVDDPARLLTERGVLEFLRDHPLDEPRLDPELIERVLDSLPPADELVLRARVYLLDTDEVRQFARGDELLPA
jgi:hypothetical protein